MAFSGINPLDCKERQSAPQGVPTVPHYDGSGWIDQLGTGVSDLRVGDPVWVFLARGYGGEGTAQDYLVLPRWQVRRIPPGVPLADGACAGIPALTAYRCLTVHEGSAQRLGPGSLSGRQVLVPGGAGAVGNAAIQLARWAGARVLTTIRGERQAELAQRAGADVVVDRSDRDALASLSRLAPSGVDIVVEVDPAGNANQSAALCAHGAVVAAYGRGGREEAVVPMRPFMAANVRLQWVRLLTLPKPWLQRAADGVTDALGGGALHFGESRGLPVHEYPFERVREAHEHAEKSGGGKVLLTAGVTDGV